jgi:hypothetical protein
MMEKRLPSEERNHFLYRSVPNMANVMSCETKAKRTAVQRIRIHFLLYGLQVIGQRATIAVTPMIQATSPQDMASLRAGSSWKSTTGAPLAQFLNLSKERLSFMSLDAFGLQQLMRSVCNN